ncbi:retrovirus-related pol polyprotein from transposon TNT 1-94 [Tanacetum coccineum]
MTGQRSQLINFVSKFLGTVKFGNNQIAKIIGYGDYKLGNVTILWVYYDEGLGNNLFSIGQFCDSGLKVAFRKHTCYVHNLEGVDLISGSKDTNLFTISLDDMLKSSLICLPSKASKTKSWLWHHRFSYLNFGTLNQLAKQGKSKKYSHKPKADDTNQEKLYLLHMDLYGPMRVESINGKKYILFIVDDYSKFTWVKFLRSKDETPENGVVKRWNHNLMEVARTMLIFSKAPLIKSIRIFITNAANKNMTIYQMDVKAAFLNGELREVALRAWYEMLSSFLLSQEFYKASTNPAMCDEFAKTRNSNFKMPMMGKMSFFLGLQISQSPRGIFINQSKYTLEIIKKYGMQSSDPVDTPMVDKSKLDEDLQGKPIDPTHYHGMTGSHMHLTSSKPYLVFITTSGAKILDEAHLEVHNSWGINLSVGHPKSKRVVLSPA